MRMRSTLSSTKPLKALLFTGTVFLAFAAMFVFGIMDESMLGDDEKLSARIVYTLGGIGFVVMVLAGMYYFQYKYRL